MDTHTIHTQYVYTKVCNGEIILIVSMFVNVPVKNK